jgi:competence protein ComGC
MKDLFNKLQSSKGFTLIELVVVIAVPHDFGRHRGP